MNVSPDTPSESLSLAEQAYYVLKEQLVTLKLAPGELVGEKDLVYRAGIGRTPVREAIQRLSSEGLLQVIPRKGLMVTSLRRSELFKIIEARRVLERLLVVKSAERATADQRRALRLLATHIEAADEDVEIFFRLLARLDELLGAACQNRFLVETLAATHGQCRRLWYLQSEYVNLPRSAQLNAGLSRAVADGDGAGAIRAQDEIIATLEGLVVGLDVLS